MLQDLECNSWVIVEVIYKYLIICVAGETSAMDATTTICHRYTPPDQLALLTRSADIIVTAAGE
jgi:5,10-methylene-tetrahydrofolate dehydrogenase/methenyl tetrahydrofolate cyclohydrolase